MKNGSLGFEAIEVASALEDWRQSVILGLINLLQLITVSFIQ